MQRFVRSTLLLIFIAMFDVALCAQALAARPTRPGNGGGGTPAYTIAVFQPAGTDSSRTTVVDVNEHGNVVGTVSPAYNGYSSWHLDSNTGAYTPVTGEVSAINDNGELVSSVSGLIVPDRTIGVFQSDLAAAPVALLPLPGDDESFATDLSFGSIIIGWSQLHGSGRSTATAWHAVVETDGTVSIHGPTPLLPLVGDETSYAARIANTVDGAIYVIGDSVPNGDIGLGTQAVLWSLEIKSDGTLAAGPPAGIGTLGLLGDATYSSGYSVNALGDACGESDLLPFLRFADGNLQGLPVPRDTIRARAIDVNLLQESVGEISTEKVSGAKVQRRDFAVFWNTNGEIVDLNTVIPQSSGWDQLFGAHRITSSGTIAGHGRYGGANRGFVMFPGK